MRGGDKKTKVYLSKDDATQLQQILDHVRHNDRNECISLKEGKYDKTGTHTFPRVISHSPSKSLITCTKKRFSSSSRIAPEIEPMAQHSVDRPCRDQPAPPGAGCTCTCTAQVRTSFLELSTDGLYYSEIFEPIHPSTKIEQVNPISIGSYPMNCTVLKACAPFTAP